MALVALELAALAAVAVIIMMAAQGVITAVEAVSACMVKGVMALAEVVLVLAEVVVVAVQAAEVAPNTHREMAEITAVRLALVLIAGLTTMEPPVKVPSVLSGQEEAVALHHSHRLT
jgi:hypothetical protein